MDCRILLSESDLAAYRSLLYRTYIEEKRWDVMPRNAAGLRVVQSPSHETLLCDRFDTVSQAFGLFDDAGTLVSGLRVTQPLEGRLELDVVHSMPQRFKASYLRRLELSRFVVKNGQDARVHLFMLFRTVAQFLKNRDCDLLFAGIAEPEYAVLFRKLGFVSSDQAMFRTIFEGSPMARLLHFDCRVQGALDQLVNRIYENDAA